MITLRDACSSGKYKRSNLIQCTNTTTVFVAGQRGFVSSAGGRLYEHDDRVCCRPARLRLIGRWLLKSRLTSVQFARPVTCLTCSTRRGERACTTSATWSCASCETSVRASRFRASGCRIHNQCARSTRAPSRAIVSSQHEYQVEFSCRHNTSTK